MEQLWTLKRQIFVKIDKDGRPQDSVDPDLRTKLSYLPAPFAYANREFKIM